MPLRATCCRRGFSTWTNNGPLQWDHLTSPLSQGLPPRGLSLERLATQITTHRPQLEHLQSCRRGRLREGVGETIQVLSVGAAARRALQAGARRRGYEVIDKSQTSYLHPCVRILPPFATPSCTLSSYHGVCRTMGSLGRQPEHPWQPRDPVRPGQPKQPEQPEQPGQPGQRGQEPGHPDPQFISLRQMPRSIPLHPTRACSSASR